MIKALIFDFDGVLASSDAPRFEALKSIAAKYDVKIEETVRHSGRGKATQKVLQEILPLNPDLAERILNEFKDDYVIHVTEYVKPIEFTVDFIREYQGTLPIAIASMSAKLTIERLTKHYGIYEKVAQIITREEVIHHKPDPEIYLRTAAVLKVRPQDCLVFEDTVIGFLAARNANMGCCVVMNGENNEEEFEGEKVYSFIATNEDLNVIVKNF